MPGKEAAVEDDKEIYEKPTNSATVMKSSSRSNPKKMVQARLPFKRLNPILGGNEGVLEEKKVRVIQNVSPLNTSIEDMENDCHMEIDEVPQLPKAVNGKGPLDHYIKKATKVCNEPFPVTIDLTEDSNISITDSQCNKQSPSLENGVHYHQMNLPNLPSNKNRECTVSKESDVFENINTSENNTDMLLQGALSCIPEPNLSPSKAAKEDCDSSVDEDSATVSSTSSPLSISSPDAQKERCSPLALTPPSGKVIANKSSTEKKVIKDKEEKKRKLQTEKEEREKAREEARLAKERAKKKRDDEKEQREKERKEKKEKEEREKAEKLRLKEEKKKEKMEALEAKQEEKRKKEEEKRLKEEEKRMKAEKAEITRFFQKPKTPEAPKTFATSCGKFAPFEIKKNMAVAPLCRVVFESETSEHLDTLLEKQNSKVSFLEEIKKREPRKMGRTSMPVMNSDVEDVQVLQDAEVKSKVIEGHIEASAPERNKFGRMKLLQFCENYRPAYWGTWNRRSKAICPRNPWLQDTALLDYELDSDEEWEEEEPGESLSHSEGENEDEDSKEEEEDDDGFFVPHGYLSDDEGGVSDEERTDPENQKVRQRLKAKEWDELQSNGKKVRMLQPIIIGCVWHGSNPTEISFLHRFSACVLELPATEEEPSQDMSLTQNLKDRQILSKLLPLLHGNVNGSKIIIQEFQECCRRGLLLEDTTSTITVSEAKSPNSTPQTPSNNIVPSKAHLKRIISENSVYEKRPDHRMCWYVHGDVLKSLEQENLPVPCQWTYITQVNSVAKEDSSTPGGPVQNLTLSSKRKSAGSMPITKFMKRARDLEMADTDEEDDCMILEVQQTKDSEASTLACKMVNLNDSSVLTSCQD
ncbi:hypothetical protein GDO86_000902 [Hymenochirus boettgeri]|uniref:Chromatin assembly factor 1 subunit A n=1 Tax=Hymenochirus boettgeri TaxID=247094 RepID=A0A8T2KAF4_9PIPI|nr:hypothetical protein GDO86_000902 [Hymenochirus boettgeri]